ncbi:hypothetical protein V5F59_15745 [Xanthobacter autotrophicus DSM 431]|uniref:hypothetical protein n=1 Tax=Xanthobacter nonsaccharivorans TaxID=3119912 RepID=UPI00372CE0A8
MICAECGRCGRRSILSAKPSVALAETVPPTANAVADEPPPRLRCDLCGSRRVRVVRFASVFDAISFVAGRGSGR